VQSEYTYTPFKNEPRYKVPGGQGSSIITYSAGPCGSGSERGSSMDVGFGRVKRYEIVAPRRNVKKSVDVFRRALWLVRNEDG
jgi:hypothetical protein